MNNTKNLTRRMMTALCPLLLGAAALPADAAPWWAQEDPCETYIANHPLVRSCEEAFDPTVPGCDDLGERRIATICVEEGLALRPCPASLPATNGRPCLYIEEDGTRCGLTVEYEVETFRVEMYEVALFKVFTKDCSAYGAQPTDE